jgi:nucleotide-binding universal stress UspA family protein
MNTVIAALDFMSEYKSVFERSTEYTFRLSARLRLVYVMESLPPSAEHWIPVQEYDKILKSMKSDYTDRLEALASLARSRGIETDYRLLYGYPSQAILDAAIECSACLLVIGHRHHGALHEIFGASVTRGILKAAQLPILVVPDASTVDGELAAAEDHQKVEEPFRFIGQT